MPVSPEERKAGTMQRGFRAGVRVGTRAALAAGAATALLVTGAVAAPAAADQAPHGASAGSGAVATGTLQAEALEVVESVRGAGPAVVVTSMTAGGASTFTSSTGASVDVSQGSLVAQDADGTILVGASLLGGSQLVVEMTGLSSGQSTIAVSDPGSTAVEEVDGPFQATVLASPDAGSDGASPDTNSCTDYFDTPTVIGSSFGPLIDGYGGISCNYDAYPALIVGLQELDNGTATGIGNDADASGTTSASTNAYAPCTSGGPNDFRTIILYNFNGGSLMGWDSSWTALDCDLD